MDVNFQVLSGVQMLEDSSRDSLVMLDRSFLCFGSGLLHFAVGISISIDESWCRIRCIGLYCCGNVVWMGGVSVSGRGFVGG